jgi:hypothetical protein
MMSATCSLSLARLMPARKGCGSTISMR